MRKRKCTLALDVDGVLNSRNWYERRQSITFPKGVTHQYREIDPDLLRNLHSVVCSTDCDIVISSAWRFSSGDREKDESRTIAHMEEVFGMFGYSFPIIGSTPSFGDRGAEILYWLAEKDNFDHICIVDDDVSDIRPYFPEWRIVKTEHLDGLTEEKAEELIRKLKGGNKYGR